MFKHAVAARRSDTGGNEASSITCRCIREHSHVGLDGVCSSVVA